MTQVIASHHSRHAGLAALPGRQVELELIARELDRAIDGEPRFILLTGDTGVGKTRLLRHAAHEAEMLAVGLYLPPELIEPEDLLEHWLAPLLLLPLLRSHHLDLSIAAAVYPRLTKHLPPTFHQPRSSSPQQAVAAICRLLSDAAERTPLLLLLDDLPRIQPETRWLVVQIAKALIDAPVAFLATARSDEDSAARALDPLLDLHLLRRLELNPLTPEALGDLIKAECDAIIVPKLLPWLHAKSLGNPLFAIELLRALEAQGFLRNGDGPWRLTGRLEALAIPHTIGHLLEARRRRLPDHLARIIPILALLGPDAPAWVLARGSALKEGTIVGERDSLVELGILERSGETYTFAHPLMVEEYRARLTREEQKEIGRRGLVAILEEISERPGYRLPCQEGSYDSGLEGGLGPEIRRILAYAEVGENPLAACLAAIELGRRCFDGRRPREAAGWARFATQRLTNLDPSHGRRWLSAQIDVLMGVALYQAGRMNAARRRLLRLVSAHDDLDLESKRRAFTYLGLLYCRTSEFDKARATFESGHDIFASMPLSSGHSATICCGFLNHMAWNELRRWDFPSARRYIDRAEDKIVEIPAESAGRARAQLHTYRALLSAGQGEYRTAVAQLEEAAEICRMDLPHALRSAENNLALALVHVGDINRARQIATRILDIETEENIDSGRPGILICLGTIAEALGEWENAIKIYEESLLLSDQFDNFSAATSALAGLMKAYEKMGDTGKSDGTWTRAVTMQQRTLPEAQMGGLFLARATALAHRQDWEGVQQICTEWGHRLESLHCQMEAAALELLAIRAELERLKVSGVGDGTIWPSQDRSNLTRRIVPLENYLRREGLRNCLVDYGQLQLHLALTGFEDISIDGVLAEILDHLRSMGATPRLADIAEEFAGTPISQRPIFKLAFAPARGTRTKPEPQRRSVLTLETASEISDARHRIHTFGRLKVLPGGCSQHLTRAQWGSRRARVLLAYLLAKDLDGRGVTREQICDAVWPDTEAFDLSNAFHISLSRLRAAFRQGQSDSNDSPISFHDGLYHLANDVWCDAREFELATTRADTLARAGRRDEALAARRAAFDLYEGEFLADTDQIWAEPRRERYRIRFLEIGNALVKAAMQERSLEEAERIAERIREIDPEGAKELRLLSLLREKFTQS